MRRLSVDCTVRCITFSSDGRYLLVGGWNYLALWDLTTGEERRIEQDACQFVTAAEITPNGQHIAWLAQTADTPGKQLRFANTNSMQQLKDSPPTDHRFDSICFFNSEILIAVRPGKLVSFDLRKSHSEFVEWSNSKQLTGIMTISRNRSLVVMGGSRENDRIDPFTKEGIGFLLVRNPLQQQQQQQKWASISYGGTPARSIAVSPEERWVAILTSDGLTVWDRAKADKAFVDITPGWDQALFTPDGQRLIITGRNTKIRILDVETWSEQTGFDWGVNWIDCCAISPDGLTAAVAGYNSEIVLWDLE